MKFELSQKFFFDASHRLETNVNSTQNAIIHGHTYFAEVFVEGKTSHNGMVIDMGIIRSHIETLRKLLDHKFLNDIPSLGVPTMENLCMFINSFFNENGIPLSKVSVWRQGTGDKCSLLNE